MTEQTDGVRPAALARWGVYRAREAEHRLGDALDLAESEDPARPDLRLSSLAMACARKANADAEWAGVVGQLAMWARQP